MKQPQPWRRRHRPIWVLGQRVYWDAVTHAQAHNYWCSCRRVARGVFPFLTLRRLGVPPRSK